MQTIQARHPKVLHELKDLCIEEWAKNPSFCCLELIRSHKVFDGLYYHKRIFPQSVFSGELSTVKVVSY